MADKVIKHYGTKRHSGRYPWGSGGNSQQRGSKDFLGIVDDLKAQGLSEKDIATALGMKTTEFRQRRSIEKDRQRAEKQSQAQQLYDKGMSKSAIGRRMGINESSVRELLKATDENRANITMATANMLKETIAKKGPVDVGGGTESHLGISRTKMLTALRALKDEGYNIYYVKTQQLGTGKFTSVQVLAPPGMEYKELYANRGNIASITDFSRDGGRTYEGLRPVQSLKGNRVDIRYAEDGGADKDGVLEIRRGVSDLDLGNSKYAQVRVGVDGTHYMKGMAIYSDNLPDGVDVIYNTSKKRADTPREEVFKKMDFKAEDGTLDPNNPFGTTIRRQDGALNIVYEEGDWSDWSRTISSQVLSKQRPSLAMKQLDLAEKIRNDEFDEIISLENPVIKQHLLNKFADGADAAAVDLKAAALPRQASHVILPITEMSEREVYAPMYNDGERVVLVRHPHGGIFEIPNVVVNNRNPAAKEILGNAKDAIGIHPNVAAKLSGADFDGDTVIVIPNNKGEIKTAPSLAALKNFDPREAYPKYDGMKLMDGPTKQMEMGKVSNLITDMTIKGASPNEIARAVKHSMVVIDAEKHKLNYKQSELDNGIAELKEKYQGGPTAGASTVISRASSQIRIPERKEGIEVPVPGKPGKTKRIYVDPETGEKLYTETGREYVTKKGVVKKAQTLSTKMAEAKSAFELSSGTQMETIYAEHADRLKALANRARKEALKQPGLKYDPDAKKAFAKEVESLNAKLALAEKNRPRERQAQIAANATYRAKLKANPNLDPDQKKRVREQSLTEARLKFNAKKPEIVISDREWTAIQMGAISTAALKRIINNTEDSHLKQKAMPRTAYKMTDAKVARAKAMAASGYTPAEIASQLGVSATTIRDTLG